MHGMNLFRFEAEIAQLDTVATSDGPPGYDPVFKEPKVSWADGKRTTGRVEAPTVRVRCQVETGTYLAQQMGPMGNVPDSRTTLVFKKRDLRAAGLLDENTGESRIKANDRLVAVRSLRTKQLALAIRNPPGLFAVESVPSDFGYHHDADLVVVRFEERAQGTQAGA